MKKNITELQDVILLIAKEVTNICEKNNIEYSIDGGSLLGAVRHKGFIPWDDDFDIVIPRDQYEKFLEIASKELPSDFFLQTDVNTKYYPFAFSKVLLNGTSIQEDFSKTAKVHHGVFVDIFPIDNLPSNKIVQKFRLFENSLLKNLIWVKCGYGKLTHSKTVKYNVYKFLGMPFSIDYLKKRRRNVIDRCNQTNSDQCFIADYPTPFREKNWYKNYRRYDFNNTTFFGIADYEAYLKKMFGNYMELPPVEERKVHSTEVDLGKFSNVNKGHNE